jgi:hypothetical protein
MRFCTFGPLPSAALTGQSIFPIRPCLRTLGLCIHQIERSTGEMERQTSTIKPSISAIDGCMPCIRRSMSASPPLYLVDRAIYRRDRSVYVFYRPVYHFYPTIPLRGSSFRLNDRTFQVWDGLLCVLDSRLRSRYRSGASLLRPTAIRASN